MAAEVIPLDAPDVDVTAGRTDGSGAHDRSPDEGVLLQGRSPALRRLTREIERVSGTEATVLIVGESGTGKELTARSIHRLSPRSGRAFVAVNCGAIAPSLIEAELFGHEKGSFTGAGERRRGYFEHATGGTLFLDEITEMPLAMQVKLLRVLETGRFYRVGGTEEIAVDVRIIAATNRDPELACREGSFRQDLLYRLAVFPLRVPPLRERREDIELLAQHFIAELNAQEKTRKQLSRHALDVLRTHPWPGNVRELRNTLYRAFLLADRSIDIAPTALPTRSRRPSLKGDCLEVGVGTPLAAAQREIILATLQHYEGDKRRAARALGISLKTLYNRLEAYNASASPVEDALAG